MVFRTYKHQNRIHNILFMPLFAILLAITAKKSNDRDMLSAVALPANSTASTRMAIARRIISTSFRDSSTAVMRMLMLLMLMIQ